MGKKLQYLLAASILYSVVMTLLFSGANDYKNTMYNILIPTQHLADSICEKNIQLQYTLDSIATSEPNCPEPVVINAKDGFEYLSMDTIGVPMSDDIAQILTLVKVIKQE